MNPARYGFAIDGQRVRFSLVADDCKPRGMILDRSEWLPRGVTAPMAERRIVRTPGNARGPLPARAAGPGHWPQFRGTTRASPALAARSRTCPIRWNPATERKHPVAHADSRPRALEPDRVGRHDFRHQRRQQRARTPPSSPVSTATAMPPRIDRATAGCSMRSTSAPARFGGSAPRSKARRATSATSSRPTRAARPPPTAASSSRGLAPRAFTPTTSTAASDGRSISGASTWAPTTFRRTSGARPARRSSGTAW